MTRRRTADERRAAEYYRKVATEASATAADFLAKAVRTQLPRTRRWLLEGARRSTRKAIEFRTLAAGLDLPPGQLELLGLWFVGLIVSFLPGHLLDFHRRGLARLARERRRRAGLDADGVQLVGAATPGELPPAISSPACRTQRPSS